MKKSHLAILLNFLYWIPRAYSISIYFLPGVFLSSPPVRANFHLNLESDIVTFITFYIFLFFLFAMAALQAKGTSALRTMVWITCNIDHNGYCIWYPEYDRP